jgi:sec-independent protein translocase protein TatA
MPFNIGAPELIVILVIALLVIGPGKLPDVGSALGKSIREFRKASSDVQESTRIDTSPIPPASTTQPPSQPPSSEPTTESNR